MSEAHHETKRPFLSARLIGFVICIVLGIVAGHLVVPDFRAGVQRIRNVSDTDTGAGRIRDFLSGFRPENVSEIGKNHHRVREAFEDSIAAANAGTVEIRCNGRRVALGAVVDTMGHVVTKASELKKPVVCRSINSRS